MAIALIVLAFLVCVVSHPDIVKKGEESKTPPPIAYIGWALALASCVAGAVILEIVRPG